MTLTKILIFFLFAWGAGWGIPTLFPNRVHIRQWLAFGGSILAIYWLQTTSPVRHLDFWLPALSILLVLLGWSATRDPQKPVARAEWIEIGVAAGIVLAIGATRYLGPLCCLTPSRPPDLQIVLPALAIGLILILLPQRLPPVARFMPAVGAGGLILLFIILKTEPLAFAASAGLRTVQGQNPLLANAADIQWIGFSYLAFRLLHTLRDRQQGRVLQCSPAEYLTYALFFPAIAAGPIDRAPRFLSDLRKNGPTDPQKLLEGSRRLVLGLFKKFALADGLALIALNPQNASQIHAGPWAWVLLYAYSLRIYLDFSGYTDIAIGIGKVLGIDLPENFISPYSKTNLTTFWNSWHITLAQWFRAYFFNPITRWLRTRPAALSTWIIVLIGQTGTMVLIGLWHGITWNFLIWGVWHALGLFVQNRWSDWTRPFFTTLKERPGMKPLLEVGSWLLTFHYVTLGWVWFALPTPGIALEVFGKLIGIG